MRRAFVHCGDGVYIYQINNLRRITLSNPMESSLLCDKKYTHNTTDICELGKLFFLKKKFPAFNTTQIFKTLGTHYFHSAGQKYYTITNFNEIAFQPRSLYNTFFLFFCFVFFSQKTQMKHVIRISEIPKNGSEYFYTRSKSYCTRARKNRLQNKRYWCKKSVIPTLSAQKLIFTILRCVYRVYILYSAL